MIDDQKQSEATLEHPDEALDSSEDRVKENNKPENNSPGENSPPESAPPKSSAHTAAASEEAAEESEVEWRGDGSENAAPENKENGDGDEPTLENLELKDLDLDEQTQSGESSQPQPKMAGEEMAGEEIPGETRKATVAEPPPQVQAAQVQIMEALQLEIESLKQQLAKQTEQAESVKAQSVRIAADFDNFRKRTQKEKEELEIFAKRNTITELLPVVDNFERARSQIRPANDGEMAIHKSYQGVYKNLVDCLKRLGVSAMRPEGKEFDPNYHEAMLREQTAEYPEGAVIEQLVRGYMIGDRVLRHAMVKVAAAPEEETNPSTEGNIDSKSGSESPSEQ